MAMRRSLDVSSVLSNDDLADYDVISDGHRSMESSIADLGSMARTAAEIQEPPPSQIARDIFVTPAFSVDDIQGYVEKANGVSGISLSRSEDVDQRVVKVYVDGKYDEFNAGHALQLRQAKLSFPLVNLLVGVYSDELCEQHNSPAAVPHTERCELVRHCRWVDEVVPDAPWRLDEIFLRARRIDYVAIDEGTSIDPACDKERLKGYDLVKGLRKAIPTRRTSGLSSTEFKRRRETPDPDDRNIPDSKHGTIKGIPTALKAEPTTTENLQQEEQIEENPFEEPKVDAFGTGEGV